MKKGNEGFGREKARGWPGRTEGSPGLDTLWHRKNSATGTPVTISQRRHFSGFYDPLRGQLRILRIASDLWLNNGLGPV